MSAANTNHSTDSQYLVHVIICHTRITHVARVRVWVTTWTCDGGGKPHLLGLLLLVLLQLLLRRRSGSCCCSGSGSGSGSGFSQRRGSGEGCSPKVAAAHAAHQRGSRGGRRVGSRGGSRGGSRRGLGVRGLGVRRGGRRALLGTGRPSQGAGRGSLSTVLAVDGADMADWGSWELGCRTRNGFAGCALRVRVADSLKKKSTEHASFEKEGSSS